MAFNSWRGGYRPGGGRPKGSTMLVYLKRVKLTPFRLLQWIVDWLKARPESGSRLIEEALVKHFKLKPPDKWKEGIMAIFTKGPTCHHKQAAKNKRSMCGEFLDKAKQSQKVKYLGNHCRRIF